MISGLWVWNEPFTRANTWACERPAALIHAHDRHTLWACSCRCAAIPDLHPPYCPVLMQHPGQQPTLNSASFCASKYARRCASISNLALLSATALPPTRFTLASTMAWNSLACKGRDDEKGVTREAGRREGMGVQVKAQDQARMMRSATLREPWHHHPWLCSITKSRQQHWEMNNHILIEWWSVLCWLSSRQITHPLLPLLLLPAQCGDRLHHQALVLFALLCLRRLACGDARLVLARQLCQGRFQGSSFRFCTGYSVTGSCYRHNV